MSGPDGELAPSPLLMPTALDPARAVAATSFRFDGVPSPAGSRVVATEVPVSVQYGTVPYAVMMLTPADLEDFAAGFSLTEGVIAARDEIRSVAAEAGPDGVRLDIELAPGRFHAVLARRRAMAGRTSCGVCGIEDLADLPRARVRGAPAPDIRLGAIRRALDELADGQLLHAQTGAMHAAAWAGLDGAIAAVREDVGRHNALDKLIGAALARGEDAAQGFLLVTSRCSYEMVEKAAAFGAGTLVAISAPTLLGVERARHHGMTLLGLARRDSVTAYAGAERVLAEPMPADDPEMALPENRGGR